MDQQQPTGFWLPHDDRRDAAEDLKLAHKHEFSTFEGNRYVQRCNCGEFYRTDVPGSH
jgi:hypothetical protein